MELPTGCVPYSVKRKSDSDKKCPQGCLLTGFDSDTDASKRAGLPAAYLRVTSCDLSNKDAMLINAYLPALTATPTRPGMASQLAANFQSVIVIIVKHTDSY